MRDATRTAQTALIEALKLAGIEVPMLQQEAEERYQAPSYDDEDDDDDDEHEESETDDD